MNTLLDTIIDTDRLARVETTDFVTPRYEVNMEDSGLKLELYLPDVPSSGVEITLKGPDLIVTARRSRQVRVNFSGAHLEPVLHDYRLVLRVGTNVDADHLTARLTGGVLRLQLPSKATRAPFDRKVA